MYCPSGSKNLDDLEPAPNLSAADAYSVFVHLVQGGIDCIGDFRKLDEALGYAIEIADQFGWPIHDWTGHIRFTGESSDMHSTVVDRIEIGFDIRIILIRDYDERGERSRRLQIESDEIEILTRPNDGSTPNDSENRVRPPQHHLEIRNYIDFIDSCRTDE